MTTFEAVWVDSDGTSTTLSAANGYNILYGVSGLDAPPVELTADPRTCGDGSVLVKRRTADRYVVIPMYVNTGSAIRSVISNLADIFRGPGHLRVSENETTYRELRHVYYETGLEGDESSDLSKPGVWRKATVSLRALDPWWYADSESTVIEVGTDVAFDAAGTTFDDSATPFNGGGITSFVVPGHAEAFPVWTIVGPFTTLNVYVSGTDESFELASALADDAVLTVDSRPGSRGPSLDGGAVDWSLLTAGSRLSTLEPGPRSAGAGATGSDAGSSITVTYEPRWLTP